MDDVSVKRRSEAELRRVVVALRPDWQADALGPFEYLSGGYSNENHRFAHAGEAFVLRIPDRVRPFVDRAHEAAFYGMAHGVPMAALVAFDTASGTMLTRYVPGTLLSGAPVDAEAITSYVRVLHAALPPSGRCYDPVLLAREFLAEGKPPGWIRKLAEALNWVPEMSAPCHNDLNPWNVIVPDTGPWVTLDWEWYGDNDPLFDLVTLHQGLGLDDGTLTAMLAAWSETPVAGERLERCLTAFWLREYAWAHAEHVHGNHRPEIQAQMDLAGSRLGDLQSGTSSG